MGGSARPASIWLREERSGRGPVPEHDRARIAVAAVTLADAGGLAAVSMRKVASAVGAGAASLYRYVDNRDELLELMADAVAGELDTDRTGTGDWRADLVAVARDLERLHQRHPWLLDLSAAGRTAVGPNAVDHLEHTLGLLRDVDAPAHTKLEAIALLNGFVTLAVRTALAGRGDVWQRAQVEYISAVAAAGNHPNLTAALSAAPASPPSGDLIDHVLPRMLNGLLGTG
ncbi:MAG: TetR/AcrR family transcriptional regulator C-terminal domain-containing protein [Pseudonocardia sp.]|nr:TetR/AcrR family transcriptional regulator C-terminal domain-containing protein [Pseudonocardia sp.]